VFWITDGLASELPDLDAPLKSGGTAPHDSAVVVGLEDYYELPDVPYAERDAAAFRDWLIYTRGVPSDRVAVVPKANREKLLAAARDAGARTGADGTVWVYFAGHGGASPETGERMLMGVDVQPDLETLTARSVPVAELRTAVTAGGGRAVLVLDTCYTGRGRAGDELLPGKRFAVPASALAPEPRVVEWTAAGPNQFSGPLEAARHGAFTWAVLGALRGWADGQLDGARDGTVTAEEARLYVEETLRTLGVRDQVPALEVEGARDWALAAHPRGEPAPDLRAAVTTPAAAPPPVAPVAPVAPPAPSAPTPGAARACFKRSKSVLEGATVRIDVDSGARALASLALGQEACVEVSPGALVLDLKVTGGLVPATRSVTVNVAPGATSWFFVGPPPNLLSGPAFAEVDATQYAEGRFKLLR
jgi:hypothetical protein